MYYVLPHGKFPQACGTQVFKHRHQEVTTKVDETVTLKFIYGQAVVLYRFVENAVARKEALAFSDNL